MTDWMPIETMPFDRKVVIKSITGIECTGKASNPYNPNGISVNAHGVKCVYSKRDDGGDITAVQWKNLPSDDDQ